LNGHWLLLLPLSVFRGMSSGVPGLAVLGRDLWRPLAMSAQAIFPPLSHSAVDTGRGGSSRPVGP